RNRVARGSAGGRKKNGNTPDRREPRREPGRRKKAQERRGDTVEERRLLRLVVRREEGGALRRAKLVGRRPQSASLLRRDPRVIAPRGRAGQAGGRKRCGGPPEFGRDRGLACPGHPRGLRQETRVREREGLVERISRRERQREEHSTEEERRRQKNERPSAGAPGDPLHGCSMERSPSSRLSSERPRRLGTKARDTSKTRGRARSGEPLRARTTDSPARSVRR